ncbi:MAG: hypothetical protein MJ007_01955 [Paludibacteraceae bacterium]|nr:hypothetical protein [Paludibacteraceae bacterium]
MALDGMSPADLGAIMGNNNNDGFGGNSAWWIIILFLFAFCGGWGNNGFGGAGSGAMDNYVLNSDFATLQRQLSDGFGGVEKGIDTIRNGLCDGFYTSAQLNAQTNTNILQSANALQSQLASCCCDIREGISGVNYNMAMNSNALQSAVQNGFCQTNFNGQSNTRDIIESQNANTRAILDALNANKVEALKDRIAEQNQMINSLQLASSQARQNEYLVDKLGTKCPIPAYLTCNPNAPLNYSVNYGCGCNG